MKHLLLYTFMLFAPYISAQQTQYLDFTVAYAAISIDPSSKSVSGSVKYNFDVLKPTNTLVIDAKNMTIEAVYLNNEPVKFKYQGYKIEVSKGFKSSKNHTLLILFNAQPQKALYFLKRKEDWNIWTQGQGKYTSNWLPSFDDVTEKVIFNLSVTFNQAYQVLANGVLDSVQQTEGLKTWYYRMKKPMSSYLVALAIGKYQKVNESSKSGIPLVYHYFTDDSLKFAATYRYSKKMFDFLEEAIGVTYPWQIYQQVPVYDFLYAGMENTSLTIFSDEFMVDDKGFYDKNYVNVNAHELAHQWFGNMVTATSGAHHWLQEGFATYYALLAEQEVFGEDYYYFKLFENAQALLKQDMAGAGTSLLNPKASSLTFYQRGAWVLHALKSLVGAVVFKKAVKSYLEKHQFKTATTSDFISLVEKYHGKSLKSFVASWIHRQTFPYENAIRLIHDQSTYIQAYLQADCEAYSSKCEDYLKYHTPDDVKVKVITQQPQLITAQTFKNSIKVRQAIATYLKDVPVSLKEAYESLLDDNSYITIENALYNLWKSFPQERSRYLSKTRNIEGFNDKNVRLLWLVLHLNTPEYQADSKAAIYSELLSYTYSHYPSNLRLNAFNYLKLMNACDAVCKINLEEATTHHNWRLVKYAKEMLNNSNNTKQ